VFALKFGNDGMSADFSGCNASSTLLGLNGPNNSIRTENNETCLNSPMRVSQDNDYNYQPLSNILRMGQSDEEALPIRFINRFDLSGR
jgi:hypothetical protein